MNELSQLRINNALVKVADAMTRHERFEDAPLSILSLIKVKKELEEMIGIKNSKFFKTGYPRFILDWPVEDFFIDELVNIAYLYNKKIRGSLALLKLY